MELKKLKPLIQPSSQIQNIENDSTNVLTYIRDSLCQCPLFALQVGLAAQKRYRLGDAYFLG